MTATAAVTRPRVKVCGVRSAAEALLAAELGADLIGLNFHPPSPRCLELSAAREIAAAVKAAAPAAGRRPLLAGVFVHASPAEAAAIADEVGLDLLQLHGEAAPQAVAPHSARALVALRPAGPPRAEDLAPWRTIGVWGLLLDTRHPGLYGGTGKGWDFATAAGLAGPDERLFIAGGLHSGNILDAVAAARPWGVDLCSGLESAPGIRNPQLLRELFGTLARSFPPS